MFAVLYEVNPKEDDKMVGTLLFQVGVCFLGWCVSPVPATVAPITATMPVTMVAPATTAVVAAPDGVTMTLSVDAPEVGEVKAVTGTVAVSESATATGVEVVAMMARKEACNEEISGVNRYVDSPVAIYPAADLPVIYVSMDPGVVNGMFFPDGAVIRSTIPLVISGVSMGAEHMNLHTCIYPDGTVDDDMLFAELATKPGAMLAKFGPQ